MTPTTRRLSGLAIRKFFARRLHVDGNLPAPDAEQIADAVASDVIAVEVKGEASGRLWSRWRRRAESQPSDRSRPVAATDVATSTAPDAERHPTVSRPFEPPPASGDPTPDGAGQAFDPYVFGLVPTFQREGRDGLAAKLETVASVDNLRQMARAQQIALPPDIRRGEVAASDVRVAIATAVEKRIADRRAAAS